MTRVSLSKAIADWIDTKPDGLAGRNETIAKFKCKKWDRDKITVALNTCVRNKWLERLGKGVHVYVRTDRPTHYLLIARKLARDRADVATDGPSAEAKWAELMGPRRFEDAPTSVAAKMALGRFTRPDDMSMVGCAAAMCARE